MHINLTLTIPRYIRVPITMIFDAYLVDLLAKQAQLVLGAAKALKFFDYIILDVI